VGDLRDFFVVSSQFHFAGGRAYACMHYAISGHLHIKHKNFKRLKLI
jgi:hypothetical protein